MFRVYIIAAAVALLVGLAWASWPEDQDQRVIKTYEDFTNAQTDCHDGLSRDQFLQCLKARRQRDLPSGFPSR